MINIIVAHDKNNVIGYKNWIPWSLPKEMRRFKEITKNHICVMGRKTYESIGKILPNRINIIISNSMMGCKNILVMNSVESVLEYYNNIKNNNPSIELFIIGGVEIYNMFLPYVDRMYISVILESFQGDTYFPKIDMEKWDITSVQPTNEFGYDIDYLTLRRRRDK